MWRVGRALTLTFVAAVLVASGVFYGLAVLLDVQQIDSTTKLDAKTLFDLVKLSFGVVAGAGALVALVVAYRRQRVDEAGAHREATRLHTERFSQAVDKLGSDSPAVRLGGVHALAGLADDAPDNNLRQTCIDVLCAYLRLPYSPDPGEGPAHLEEHHHYLALREVRHTILRLISDHYRRPHGTRRSWQGCDLDLTSVTIDGPMNFSGAKFSGGDVDFGGAVFSGGRVDFRGATFSGGRVDFGDATFSGGSVDFIHATFSGGSVYFGGATFSGGRVNFGGATFSGGSVNFGDATFSGGSVNFGDATFSGGRVYFRGAVFSGGGVDFRGADFRDAEFSDGTVDFRDAEFSDGTVGFRDAEFSDGTVGFRGATFSGGTVNFSDATFSGGRVTFSDATFSGGSVNFSDATFSGGRVTFSDATFSGGSVNFSDAVFSGSTVDFRNTASPAPQGLLAAVGTPTPAEVTLPSAWLLPAP
ncbi:pentapeptide repeat-containing protein [Streptomyces sp. NBC_00654]|uniref:pentapeptide repeat-containing protein n=1 Tax=Streptomyces sp. NBC_00654 TaxID=2975799 RepID=UPI00225999E0|nr:pentapeptide repeat-containing protein [Streptomyces sp. NBC_00654]MCX4971201.1 pentapeptide repeat-containing protein [Streptomyces sp. NBC_00654]MCX4971216.1 pentapeptide repeat-containing protein [Streptomyces sp. NBC_00654]